MSGKTDSLSFAPGQRCGRARQSKISQTDIVKEFQSRANFFKNLSVAEFLVEAVDAIEEGQDLLITGETTGVYECKAVGLRDTDGHPTKQVKQGQFFSLKTDTLLRRGDKLYLWTE